jgi:ribose 5-phosphate isomerase
MLGADEVPVRHTQKVAGGGGCIFQEQLVLEVAFERALAERVQGRQDADAS